MTPLLLQFSPVPVAGCCPFCQESFSFAVGTILVESSAHHPVCYRCGKRLSPELSSLLTLAEEAIRVGRIGRHTVVPPYTALLDLARVADDYSALIPTPSREAS